MVVIKRLLSKTKSCYIHTTSRKAFCFELPAEIYGFNHRVPTFSHPPKPIKFLIPDIDMVSLDAIFVLSSDSLGVFFLRKRTPIYVTEPVYEQLKMRLKYYRSMVFSYEDELRQNGLTKCLEDVRKPNIIKINLNQVFHFDSVSIKAISSGSFLGWVNYHVKNKYNFLYVKALSSENRFIAPFSYVPVDFLILNRDNDNDCLKAPLCRNDRVCADVMLKKPMVIPGIPNEDSFEGETKVRVVADAENRSIPRCMLRKLYFDIASLTKHLEKSCSEKVVVLCDFSKYLLEIIFHAFYALKDAYIFVLGDSFREYKKRLVYMGCFLNDSFKSRVYKGQDPLPFSIYPKLQIISSISEIESKEYLLFSEHNPYIKDAHLLSINSLSSTHCFFIPFDTPLDAMEQAFGAKILSNNEYVKEEYRCVMHGYEDKKNRLFADSRIIKNKSSANVEGVVAGKAYFIDTYIEKCTIEVQNADMVYVNSSQALVEGTLVYSDMYKADIQKLVLVAKDPKIKELFENERYYFFNGFYMFPKSGYVVNTEQYPYIQKL